MPRTLVLDGPRQLRAGRPARPARSVPGRCGCGARLSGISHGTELSLYRGTSAFADKVFDRGLRAFVEPPAGSASAYPVTLGYEMVSEVVEVGSGGDRGRRSGTWCTPARRTRRRPSSTSSRVPAGHLPARRPADRPSDLERGLFLSLAAVALQAVHDAEIKLGDTVSVHGLGVIGLLAVQMCCAGRASRTSSALDLDPHRRDFASSGSALPDVLDPGERATARAPAIAR